MPYRRSNGTWYSTVGGRRRSLETKDRDVAVEKEEALRVLGRLGAPAAAAAAPKPRPTTTGPTVGEVLRAFVIQGRRGGWKPRTTTLYESIAAAHTKRWGSRLARDLTRQDFEDYKLERKAAPKTVNHELGVLNSALAYAVEVKLLAAEDAPRFGKWRMKEKKVVPGYLRREQFERLIEAEQRLRTAFFLGRYAGLREEEIRTLRWAHVDLAQALITVLDSKSGDRMVDISRVLLEELVRARRSTREYVLEVRPGEPWSKSGLDHAASRAFKRAKVPSHGGHTLHLLRSTFATSFPGTLRDLMASLGHSSPGPSLRYLAVKPESRRRAIEGASEW